MNSALEASTSLTPGLLELGVDVVLGDLDLELTGEGVESQGLTGNVVGLLVQGRR